MPEGERQQEPQHSPSTAATDRISFGRGCTGVWDSTGGLTMLGVSSSLPLSELTSACAIACAPAAASAGLVLTSITSRIPLPAVVDVLIVPPTLCPRSSRAADLVWLDFATCAYVESSAFRFSAGR